MHCISPVTLVFSQSSLPVLFGLTDIHVDTSLLTLVCDYLCIGLIFFLHQRLHL